MFGVLSQSLVSPLSSNPIRPTSMEGPGPLHTHLGCVSGPQYAFHLCLAPLPPPMAGILSYHPTLWASSRPALGDGVKGFHSPVSYLQSRRSARSSARDRSIQLHQRFLSMLIFQIFLTTTEPSFVASSSDLCFIQSKMTAGQGLL